MLKFNSTNIFTGYIKQLLASFNLPRAKVYKNDTEAFPTYFAYDSTGARLATTAYENVYIKDGKYQIYEQNKWQDIDWHNCNFYYDTLDPNFTSTLEIDNNIYDSYTHEYLGEYLRFKRDFLGIDLMPLYNCFSNRQYNIKKLNRDDQNKYKIYEIPVKFFKDYTIAIDNNAVTELFCGVTDEFVKEAPKSTDTSLNALLYQKTYKKIGGLIFNQPQLYDKLHLSSSSFTATGMWAQLGSLESQLKLYLKLPVTNKSSIVILEGNYLTYNDCMFDDKYYKTAGGTYNSGTLSTKKNHYVVNIENYKLQEETAFRPITSLQLLKFNTKDNYAIADRLIEYLTGNAITNEDELSDNIKRVQTVVSRTGLLTAKDGLWDNKLRPILYDKINKDYIDTNKDNAKIVAPNKLATKNNDVLGYVDKDIEQLYEIAYIDKYGVQQRDSIASVDIYDNFYEFEEDK